MKDSFKTSIFIGWLFILIGALANEWLLVTLFYGDGIIEQNILVRIRIFEIIFIAIGIFLIVLKPKIKPPSKGEIELAFIVCVLCAILMEIGLRYYLVNFASQEHYLNYATLGMINNNFKNHELRYSPHPYLGYFPTPNFKNDKGDAHNSLGFRGEEIIIPKPENEYRIVCIGGSTTYTTDVDNYKYSYPYLMEEKLKNMGYSNIKVINAGVGNADTWYSLINLEFRVLDLDPDMIIVYHGDNDVESRMVFPYEFYRGDNTGRVVSLIEKLQQENIIDKSLTLRIVGRILFGYIKPYGSLHGLHSADTCVYDEYFSQINNNTYPQGIFKNIDGIDILNTNKPIYTERNVRNMIAVCNANGINIVLSSFISVPLSEETSSKLYQKAIEDNNKIMKALSFEYKTPFFDFKRVMPIDKKYWVNRGVHVNEQGAKIKAELFADFIKNYIKE